MPTYMLEYMVHMAVAIVFGLVLFLITGSAVVANMSLLTYVGSALLINVLIIKHSGE